MKKQFILSLEDGNCGIIIKFQWSGENSQANFTEICFQLPQPSQLLNDYQNWLRKYQSYEVLHKRGIIPGQSIRFSMPEYIAECDELLNHLLTSLNDWLSSIKQQLQSILDINSQDEIHVVLQTHKISCELTKNILHKLPWHRWEFFSEDCLAEVAISFTESEQISPIFEQLPISGRLQQVKILCILGESSRGIDVERDRQAISKMPGVYHVFLRQPSIAELKSTLSEGGDIFLYSGHSSTPDDGKTVLLELNSEETLNIQDIKIDLEAAGIKLAFFNSCNSLGIAYQLADLDIAQIIVWRELVPDEIAQKFLKFFFESFTERLSLYSSVRKARLKVQEYIRENDQLPEISWLPIIHHNLDKKDITWLKLRTKSNIIKINRQIDIEHRLSESLKSLLRAVDIDWVQKVLEESLHQEVVDSIYENTMRREEMLELELEELFDKVEPPLLRSRPLLNQSGKLLHPGTRAVNRFYELPQEQRTMLILGEPGSGKTIALLQIARQYIEDIRLGSVLPVPVYLNLSTWDSKKLLNQQRQARQNMLDNHIFRLLNFTSRNQQLESFTFWLGEELHRLYKFPKNQCLDWIKQENLLLLLDGLDEVNEEQRNACISAINRFVLKHTKTEMVVCCRSQDYRPLLDLQSEKLRLHCTILIQPFTLGKIQLYFSDLGQEFLQISELLPQEKGLQDLAKTPFMLRLITSTYKNKQLWRMDSKEERSQDLFENYIHQGLEKDNSIASRDFKQKARSYLTWLAKQKNNLPLSVILIEEMQASWLSSDIEKRIYNLGFRMIFGLIAGFGASLHFGTQVTDDLSKLLTLIIPSIIAGLITGLCSSIIPELILKFTSNVSSLVISTLISCFIFILTIVLLVEGSVLQAIPDFMDLLSPLMIDGIVIGLFFSLVSEEIEVVDTIKWSWKQAKNFSFFGLFFVGLIYIPMRLLLTDRYYHINGYHYLIYELLFFPLLSGVIGGLSKEESRTKYKNIIPNQGIWESAINFCIFFMAAFPIGIILALPYSRGGLHEIISIGLSVGLLAGLAGGRPPVFAGFVLIKHFILRIILWWQGSIPWNYAHFLDYATKYGFLRKVGGGGYIFIHDLLREHFAQTQPNRLQD